MYFKKLFKTLLPVFFILASTSNAGSGLSKKAIESKKNGELFSEVFRTVFGKKIKDKIFFGDWVDTMNQGGSLEGIYNALVHSNYYRSLEKTGKNAKPKSLRFFVEEMNWIQGQLNQPEYFTKKSALPLPKFKLGNLVEKNEGVAIYPKKQDKKQLKNIFSDASVYVLKRVLADEVLKRVDEIKSNRKLLAKWFAHLAVRLNQGKVYFGLELRQKMDVDFHRNWALQASEDLLKWEILNRYHRILNAGG